MFSVYAQTNKIQNKLKTDVHNPDSLESKHSNSNQEVNDSSWPTDELE